MGTSSTGAMAIVPSSACVVWWISTVPAAGLLAPTRASSTSVLLTMTMKAAPASSIIGDSRDQAPTTWSPGPSEAGSREAIGAADPIGAADAMASSSSWAATEPMPSATLAATAITGSSTSRLLRSTCVPSCGAW